MNKAHAVFIGWQLGLEGEKLFPLFNILGDHPRARSTVSTGTLQELGIEVPEYK